MRFAPSTVRLDRIQGNTSHHCFEFIERIIRPKFFSPGGGVASFIAKTDRKKADSINVAFGDDHKIQKVLYRVSFIRTEWLMSLAITFVLFTRKISVSLIEPC